VAHRGSFGPDRSGAAWRGSWPRQRLADPPRPSAGRAAPDVVTSDTLCRGTAPASGSPVSLDLADRAPACAGSRPEPPRQDPIPARRVRAGRLVGPGRLPSVRCSTSLPSRARMRSLFGNRSLAPHPSRPARSGSPVTRSGRSVLPNPVLATLAGAADNAGKMPLTDFCNRPSARAPTESAGFPRCLARRLAASPAQVRGRLTPPSQLQPSPRRPSCEGERRTGTALPCGGLFGRSQRSELDL
jgi:hypothetical protein